MQFWTASKIWKDSTAFILGGGPSVLEADLSLIKNKRVIGVNNAYKLGDWIDICWFGDSDWYEWHKEKLVNFSGMIIHCADRHIERPNTKCLRRGEPNGIDIRPTHVSWNNNSGASAINLAYHLGVKRVVLLGFDMQKTKHGQNNWHNDHPKRNPMWNPYPQFLKSFDIIKIDAERLNFEIINATENSALTHFPKIPLEKLI